MRRKFCAFNTGEENKMYRMKKTPIYLQVIDFITIICFLRV